MYSSLEDFSKILKYRYFCLLMAADVPDFCKSNPTALVAADDNCAQYYNCSDPRSSLGAYVEECNYPDLFSTYSMSCGGFTRTLCGTRPEPQTPCMSCFIFFLLADFRFCLEFSTFLIHVFVIYFGNTDFMDSEQQWAFQRNENSFCLYLR